MEEINPEWVSTSLNMTKELATSCFCKDLQCKMAAEGFTWPAMPQGAQGNLTVCSQLTWHMVKPFVAESTDVLSDHVNLRPIPPTVKYFRRLWFLFQNLSASVVYTKVISEKPLPGMKGLILHIWGTQTLLRALAGSSRGGDATGLHPACPQVSNQLTAMEGLPLDSQQAEAVLCYSQKQPALDA